MCLPRKLMALPMAHRVHLKKFLLIAFQENPYHLLFRFIFLRVFSFCVVPPRPPPRLILCGCQLGISTSQNINARSVVGQNELLIISLELTVCPSRTAAVQGRGGEAKAQVEPSYLNSWPTSPHRVCCMLWSLRTVITGRGGG